MILVLDDEKCSFELLTNSHDIRVFRYNVTYLALPIENRTLSFNF